MAEQQLAACKIDLPAPPGDDEEIQVLLPANQNSAPSKVSDSRSRKLMLLVHLVASCLVIAHLAANVNYLVFKSALYVREIRALVRFPWLLIVLTCEYAYFVSNLMAAVDHLLPPGIRADLTLPEDTENFHCPTVHILLPCCNEPTEVPQESIQAALAMQYPQDRFKVLVLDDGSDDNLKSFCETLDCEQGGKRVVYLRREKVLGVPHQFKCGNLNYGLQHSDAEYVVMMDGDMILHPSFLRKVLPHIMNSPEVAFVQVPQCYYNLPPGDPLNDASVFSYFRVLMHRDSLGSASCIGTGAIFRRKLLDEIGGFQPHSITEDTVTAFALFSRGYKSVYLTDKLQIGQAPWTLEAYIKQRRRWGVGAFQQFATTWKSMLGKGSKLNFLLRVCFVWQAGYYYLSIVNVVLAAVMLIALALRLKMSVGDAEDNRQLMVYLATSMVLWRLAWYALWVEVPNCIQNRNREESQFWWMSPFFFKMVMQVTFAYKSTFQFVPTSTIDRAVQAAGCNADDEPYCLLKRLGQLKHVRVHVAFVVVTMMVVSSRAYDVVIRGARGCMDMAYVVGLSVFLLTVCAHMLVPMMHLVWTTISSNDRKMMLRYDEQGVVQFNINNPPTRGDSHTVETMVALCGVLLYELLSYATLAFWLGVLFLTSSNTHLHWCAT